MFPRLSLIAALLFATPVYAKDITITLNDQEQKALYSLLDLALKQGGLANMNAVMHGGGIGYAGIMGSALRTWTWTNMTERFDEVVEGNNSHTGADTVSTGSITVTATASGAMAAGGLVLGSWGP